MYIRAFVTPGSRRDHIERAPDGSLRISVRAPGERNQANKRVLELVAKEFAVSVTDVTIYSGHHARAKVISINN